MNNTTKRLTLSLDPDIRKKLKIMAAQEDVSLSTFIKTILIKIVDKYEDVLGEEDGND